MRRRQYLERAVPLSVIAASGLAGCSGDGGDGSSDGGDAGTSDGGSSDGSDGNDGNDGDDGGGQQTQTLELWHDKGQNPNWNPIFEATLPKLNDQVIDGSYEVEAVPYQSTDSYQGAIRPVLGQEQGPAFFTWWTGARLRNMIQDEYAYDITDVWQSHVDNGEYSEAMMSNFGTDGKAYAIPSQMAFWSVWYNTETFDELGVEPPSSWDEFEQLCQTITEESDSTSPVAIPLGPPWTGFIWFEDLLVRADPEFYDSLCRGEAKYTDDPSVNTIQRISDMASSGYFGDENTAVSLQLDDLPKVLESGDYAMTLMGSWISSLWSGDDIDFEKYDWFELPAPNADTGKQLIVEPGPFVPHAGHSDKESLKAVADALLSTEFQQAWFEEQGFIPANQKVDTSYLSNAKADLADATQSGEYDFPLRYWENTSPEVAAPGSKTLKRAYRSNADAEAIASELDKLRKEVYE